MIDDDLLTLETKIKNFILGMTWLPFETRERTITNLSIMIKNNPIRLMTFFDDLMQSFVKSPGVSGAVGHMRDELENKIVLASLLNEVTN